MSEEQGRDVRGAGGMDPAESVAREIDEIRSRSRCSMRFGHTVAKNLGASYALVSLADSCGLREGLTEAYGDRGDWILSMAVSMMIASDGCGGFVPNPETNMSRELLGIPESEYQSMPRFLRAIGREDDSDLIRFLRSWASSAEEAMVYDGSLIPLTGGAVPGDDDLCMGFVIDPDGIPIMYAVAPRGSFENPQIDRFISRMEFIGIRRCNFIFERRTGSPERYRSMVRHGIRFISKDCSRYSCCGDVSEYLQESGKEFVSRGKRYLVASREVAVVEDGSDMVTHRDPRFQTVPDSERFRMWIVKGEDAMRTDRARVERRISVIERRLRSLGPKQALEQFQETAGSLSRFFRIGVSDGCLDLEVRRDELEAYLDQSPETVYSNGFDTWEEASDAFDLRGSFDRVGEAMGEMLRLVRFQGDEGCAEGRDVVRFVSMILWCTMSSKLEAAGMHTPIPTVLERLDSIKAVGDGSDWKVMGVTPGDRMIFQALGIRVPKTLHTPRRAAVRDHRSRPERTSREYASPRSRNMLRMCFSVKSSP